MRVASPEEGAARPEGETWGRRLTWGLLILAVLGLGVRIWAATVLPVGYDEFWHVFIARNLSREIRSLAHPPLFILLLRACDALWHSTWAYRAVSLASGAAVVLLFGHVLRKLRASPSIVLLGALGAALSGSLVRLSVVVESYMLCAVFVLLAFSFAIDLLDPRPPLRSRLLFSLAACLALLTHYAAALFLSATVVALFVAVVRRGTRAGGGLRSRIGADVATLLPPLAVGATLYVLLARSWVRALNHLPSFYFDPARESVGEFLGRNLAATAKLLLPAPESRLAAVGLLALFAGATLAIPFMARAESAARGRRLLPAGVFALLLLLGMLLGLLGKYPFGGLLRHQLLLLLFAPLAAWMALDALRVRAAAQALRRALTALGFAAVAILGTLAASEIHATPRLAAPLLPALDRDYGAQAAVYLDQFNLIGFFLQAHEQEWAYAGPLGTQGLEAYRLEGNGGTRTVLANRSRWILDLADPGVYREAAAAARLAGQPCPVLYVTRQVPLEAEPSEASLRAISSDAGLDLKKASLSKAFAFAQLCLRDGGSAQRPRLTRVVPPSTRAAVGFQIQPDGSSALSIVGFGFRPGVTAVLSGRPLPTFFGNPEWITATVPKELFARPGRLELRVLDPEGGPSEPIFFEVIP
jgi:hypothetical protein